MIGVEYITVEQAATKWKISERRVRTYCTDGRIDGAFKQNGIWKIPAQAQKPARKPRKPETVLDRLRAEKRAHVKGGIYHRLQVDMAYNSNHMEGSRLTHEQTRLIYETNTIGLENAIVRVDDIVETVNHFRCLDYVIDSANAELTEKYLKTLHELLKTGTTDSRRDYFAVGDYKRLPNEVGGRETTPPERVKEEIGKLLQSYRARETKTLEDIVAFHVAFERIHPFQDGNGRVGRLIMMKECLRNEVVPFIIQDEFKLYYYRGLQQWDIEQGYLLDTCRAAQDRMKSYLNYFRIEFQD